LVLAAAAQTDSAAATAAELETAAEDQDTVHRGKSNSQPTEPPVEFPHGADLASGFVPRTAP
jgi:hypothetical protein